MFAQLTYRNNSPKRERRRVKINASHIVITLENSNINPTVLFVRNANEGNWNDKRHRAIISAINTLETALEDAIE